MPEDPIYGFPNLRNADGTRLYPDPNTQSLVAWIARGNIVIGDYTSDAFQSRVVPQLDPRTNDARQPYAVEPKDAELGYQTGSHGIMYDAKGRPLFDGNYNQQDKDGEVPGTKADGTPRKFYESSLSDAAFQQLVPNGQDGQAWSPMVTIDQTLFTNHAIAGVANSGLSILGTMAMRDEALVISPGQYFQLDHDRRLLLDPAASQIGLPMSIGQARLLQWEECPADGCPPNL